jgi:glucose/arabinose dehydrogenase
VRFGRWTTARLVGCAAAVTMVAACDGQPSTGTSATVQAPTSTAATSTPAAGPSGSSTSPSTPSESPAQPPTDPGAPTLHLAGLSARKVTDVAPFGIRLLQDPRTGLVYLLHPKDGLSWVNLRTGKLTHVATVRDIVDGEPAGMAFGPDGTAFVVANKTVGKKTHAVIRRGRPAGDAFSWTTLAMTDDYPLADGPVNHLWNGIAVSPDGTSVYVNAGSRTDHGEVEDDKGAFPGVRELPLTSAIFKLPADVSGLVLHDTTQALQTYLYADGTRNAYSLAFAPSGELFATDNGPDADFPDELNLIQQGKHYGFPWRFGSQANPQATAGYDPATDVFIRPDSSAAKLHRYTNDPNFPKATATFTDPLPNSGPDAVSYRGLDGAAHDAATDGVLLTTFTPHRSPLGLTFTGKGYGANAAASQLHAFVLSWGASIGDLPDRGLDLLAVNFVKGSAGYSVTSEQVASGFNHPIDEVMVDGHLYVLEMGSYGPDPGNVSIWELTFA